MVTIYNTTLSATSQRHFSDGLGGNLYLCNLHGGTGNQREATWMVRKIHSAISRGEMDSVIIVSPQAMPERKELFFS